MTDEQQREVRENTTDFLAHVQTIRSSASDRQFDQFLSELDDESRNLVQRFLREQREFPCRYSPHNEDCRPGSERAESRGNG